MKKNISKIIVLALLILNLNITFADSVEPYTKYPSISDMFVGEDKYENFNRKIFNFNFKLNRIFVKNIHILWASIVPNFLIDAFNHAYFNIEYPKKVVSSLLQRDFEAIRHETKRFIINTTLGLAGLVDIAQKVFDLEPYNEDMEQGLAKCKMKCGNYLVLPFLSSTNTRDITGRIFDFALTPTTYIASPIAAAIKMGLLINRTAYIQPIIKMVESSFRDPYEIAKKVYGVEKYIKLSNYDRKNVIEKIKNDYDEIELVDNQNKEFLEVQGKLDSENNLLINTEDDDIELNADIILDNFNPQNPVLDSIRTALFDLKKDNSPIWSEISIWNRCFDKKIKTGYIPIEEGRAKYKFRYVLQKDVNAPLVIILPSVGENIYNSHSAIFAKKFYDKGYSAIILGSNFQWEFLKSTKKGYAAGNSKDDAEYLVKAIDNSISYLSKKYKRNFLKRTLIGTSLGAYNALFVANKQYQTGANNIDKFIAICPPFELMYAISKIDEIIECWKKHPDNIQEQIATITAKVERAYKDKTNIAKNFDKMPFSAYEGKLISSFVFHQKISDMVYQLETDKTPDINKKELYQNIYSMNYNDYIKKYLLVNYTYDELSQINSLNSISDYLINSDNYIIYHSLDDYLTNKEQLKKLRRYCDDKLVIFNNGSHLGFLYRDEFNNHLDDIIKSSK